MLELNDYRAIAMLASRMDIPFDKNRLEEDNYCYVTTSRIVIGDEYIMMGEHTLECPEINHTCSGNPTLPIAAFRYLTTRRDVVIGELKIVLADYLRSYTQRPAKAMTESIIVTYEYPRIIIHNPKNDKTLRFNMINGQFSHYVKSRNEFVTVPRASKNPMNKKQIDRLSELLMLAGLWTYNPMFAE